ncbi:MAG: hypothetical protein GY858_04115 [Candidatus Omnitrophica bacterium]|nr:hypothetical protein [Candidatus Omnitrophota bacterium]
MKKVLIAAAFLIFAGCVSTLITKEVQVHKDKDGTVEKIVEIERVTQQDAIRRIKLEHLKTGK